MAAACSDFERVFEIGPVFRAENSNTVRKRRRWLPLVPHAINAVTHAGPRRALIAPCPRSIATCASSTAST